MNLRIIRKQLGLSQKEIAEKLDCSPTVYSRYETGERQPSIDVLIKLSRILNVSVDEIIGNPIYFSPGLSVAEQELLGAFYNADERGRQDALSLLKMHTTINAEKK